MVAALLAVHAPPAAADPADERRALVMLRVLAYDKRLGARAGDEVRILVLYADGGDSTERSRWTAAFANARKLKVDGRSVVVSAHRFESAKSFARVLRDLGAAAVVVCDGVAASLPVKQLAAITREHHALTFTTREHEVAKGLAVGIVRGKSRDEIVVNARAAAAEGVKFDAGLLQLARAVEEAP